MDVLDRGCVNCGAAAPLTAAKSRIFAGWGGPARFKVFPYTGTSSWKPLLVSCGARALLVGRLTADGTPILSIVGLLRCGPPGPVYPSCWELLAIFSWRRIMDILDRGCVSCTSTEDRSNNKHSVLCHICGRVAVNSTSLDCLCKSCLKQEHVRMP